ncbi:PREDICTED: uncharacterized protein LOC109115804 [Nelumbo nucifera]|uniref:Uncharacterized protein LOC109115804 n=1 Tax=Nelumbo nucifera TaxID=4432 RepID=A0A1U8QAC3_NELNU|nr:PREDICTED: uncharacterized protein LOC109115804 [Nelumbo nucifera]
MDSHKDVYVPTYVLLGSNDSAGRQNTTVKLDGTNFLEWSQSAKLTIEGRGKLGFITSKEVKPKPEDPNYSKWEQDNLLVMSWLGEKLVAMYFSSLQSVWEEIDHLEALEWKDPIDAKQYRKCIEKNRVFDFLVGLNADYDFTRQHILSADILSLSTAYSLVQNEESRRCHDASSCQ